MGFATINPATEEILKSYEYHTEETVQDKLCLASESFLEWKERSISERAQRLAPVAGVLRDHREIYAREITLEMGKPIQEARAEIDKCAWLVDVYAEQGPAWLEGEVLEADGIEHWVNYEPLGLVLSIMPWNFPFWQALRFGIPALLAGNTTLLKHSLQTSGCAVFLEELFLKAALPEGIFQSLLIDHESTARLIEHKDIRGVSLTGSNLAGSKIGTKAGQNLKKIVLELGGSDPFVVLQDADLEKAVEGAVKGRLLNTGQSCIAAKRFIVHQSLADQFAARLAESFQNMAMGDPLDENTQVGPLSSQRALEGIKKQVEDALSQGASALCGAKTFSGKGFFYEPTVLVNVTEQMQVLREEVFGPVAPVISFATEDEAVKLANDTPFGLGASVWGEERAHAVNVLKRIECGCGFVNSIVKSDPRIPFGGVKESGLGRELSKWGLREFTNVKAYNVY